MSFRAEPNSAGFQVLVTGNNHKVAAFLHAHSGYLGNQSLRANLVSGLSVRMDPWDLPDPGIEPASPPSPALADGFFTTSAIWEDHDFGNCGLFRNSPSDSYINYISPTCLSA